MNSGSDAINDPVNLPVGQRLRELVRQTMEAVKGIIGAHAAFQLQGPDVRELVAAIRERHGRALFQRAHERACPRTKLRS